MRQEILRMENISKNFPGVKALSHVNFNVLAGEIIALVGENGAGKSTLMKILSGVYEKDEGKIIFDGREVVIESPLAAQSLGISIIHQELNLMPNLSIYENIYMGREIRSAGIFLDRKRSIELTRDLLQSVGLEVAPDCLIRNMSIAQRQMVEIARALSAESKLIIMDEPTSSLTERETEILNKIIRKLSSQGVSIIYISHKLDEVLELADRVVALRDGHSVGVLEKEEICRDKMIRLMVGRELKDIFPKSPHVPGEEILRAVNISTKSQLKNISFNLRRGEILGFAGLVGSGRTELMNVIFGLDHPSSGEIYINNQLARIDHPSQALEHRIGYVPEDRKLQGLILGMNVRENTTLSILEFISRTVFIRKSMDRKITQDFIQSLSIKTPGTEQIVVHLSGGNQQKVVLAKMLAIKPQILILDEPTRGVDVGAKKEIHAMIDQLACDGIAIILISSELPEILGMSDRIMVMCGGKIAGELDGETADQEQIMHFAFSHSC